MFYEFTQNNSGGSFQVDDEICHRLFIEADSQSQAEQKAFDMGVYYNGCAIGQDCPCCGDRWYTPDEFELPVNFGGEIIKNIEDYAQMLADRYGWTRPDARIFYKNGKVTEILRAEDKPF